MRRRPAGLVAADRRDAPTGPAPAASRRATCWSRSAPATSTSSPTPRGGGSHDERVPPGVERDYPLARLTTIRTGGPADFFARPESEERARRAARLGRGRGARGRSGRLGIEPARSGRGIPRTGDQAGRDLAQIERDGERLLCGGGARLPSAAAMAAGWGLTGLEFGVNIPGTVGGAVRMNANAYGGELARVLEWVDVCTAAGSERRRPDELGFALPPVRTCGDGEIVARRSFSLAPAESGSGQGDARRHAAQPQGGAAVRHQDLRLDLQEPRRPACRGPHRRPAARRGRLPRPAGRRRPLLARSTRTSSRTRARPPRPTCSR